MGTVVAADKQYAPVGHAPQLDPSIPPSIGLNVPVGHFSYVAEMDPIGQKYPAAQYPVTAVAASVLTYWPGSALMQSLRSFLAKAGL